MSTTIEPGWYIIKPQREVCLPKVAHVFDRDGLLWVRAEQLGDRNLDSGLYQGWSWGPRVNL